jgi:RHS repeat-associated protein
MAKANPFRFSTKYQDDETDLLYYGYRFYNASTGRWISRDPIAEQGIVHPYLFVNNKPTSAIDKTGLITIVLDGDDSYYERCGHIKLLYDISLSHKPQCEGFIVQHLQISRVGSSCKGNPKSDPLEMWEVIGDISGDDMNLSKWTVQDENTLPYMLKKGYIQVKREVGFFCKSLTGDLNTLWPYNSIPGYRTGHIVRTEPWWWMPGENSDDPMASNTWSVTYNCCCPRREAAFHDTAPQTGTIDYYSNL